MTTGQNAVFACELSQEGVTNGEWWLGDNLLQNNDLNQMTCQGRVHRLTLQMVTPDDSGDVAFVVGEEKTVACLLVEEKPKGNRDVNGDVKDGLLVLTHLHLSISISPSLSSIKQLCLGTLEHPLFICCAASSIPS